MRQIARDPWTASSPDAEELDALIAAAAEVVPVAHLPSPSRRSHVALFPMDGSRRGLSILAPKVRMRWLIPAMVVWTLGAGALLLANRSAEMGGLPRELWGTWVADQPGSSTGAVTLGERSITFTAGSGSGAASTHAVTGVRWSRSDDGLHFTVEYVNGWTAATRARFTFIYQGGPRAGLVVPDAGGAQWHRVPEPAVASR